MNAQAILALTEAFARMEITGSLVTVLTDTVELDAEVFFKQILSQNFEQLLCIFLMF